jgi:uncharacterized sporulation protein YeaH/YhbH (DUF444 family)
MGEDIGAKRRPDELRAIARELEQMSDWELERGLASSTAFDHDRRRIADRILRARYAGSDGRYHSLDTGDSRRGGSDDAASPDIELFLLPLICVPLE